MDFAMSYSQAYRDSLGMLPLYNNTHTQKDVLALFDRTIAKLQPRKSDAELVQQLKHRIFTEPFVEIDDTGMTHEASHPA